MSARSWLYVPGDRPQLLAKSAQRGADALILDLEDAVPLQGKQVARDHVRGHLETADDLPERWVRINPTAIEEDIAAVMSPNLTGIVLAKAEADALRRVDEALAAAESTVGREPGSTPVIALVETAFAVEQLRDVARAPRVRQLAIGEADLAAELGVRPGPADDELDPVRLQLVVASAAAGLVPPIGPVSTDFRDLEGIRRSTQRLARLGFAARQVIHPAQVQVVNDVLTPTEDEVERACAVVEAFELAEERGEGVLVDDEGHMVDRATVRSARRILSRAPNGDSGPARR